MKMPNYALQEIDCTRKEIILTRQCLLNNNEHQCQKASNYQRNERMLLTKLCFCIYKEIVFGFRPYDQLVPKA